MTHNGELYRIILADPPWRFTAWSGNTGKNGRTADKHYPTTMTDALCRFSIPAAENSVLFLWACWPTLPDAMRIISAWGFEYKTIAWVWVKLNPSSVGFHFGLGYYTRANSEPCLLATRGHVPKPKARDIQALICSPIREHSRKPDEQYAKIERLYPDGPYLEMFARRKRDGWSAWGNEIENDIEIPARP